MVSGPTHGVQFTGKCIDLVGTAGATQGGIQTKDTIASGRYTISFNLYGSGRDVPTNVNVFLGSQRIFSQSAMSTDLKRFVVLPGVRGSGRLRIVGSSSQVNIGPLVDNVVVTPLPNDCP
jgi:hypothetical protein